MGGKNSKLEKFVDDMSYLDISRVEMKMFYKIFRKIATEKEQEYVTVEEILNYINVPYSHFAARALCCGFCYTDPSETEENERKILARFKFDYLTFVYSLWNYLTLCPEAFISFIFSIYDADGGGTIDPSEAQMLLRDLHGDDFGSKLEVLREYNKLAALVRKNIDLERFVDFATNHQNIFVPAVELKNKLTAAILGNVFWYIHMKKRKKLYLFKYKHVTRVVDKVRIIRERELEQEWESGGKGNKKYILAKKDQVAPEETKKVVNVLILDDSSPSEVERESVLKNFAPENSVPLKHPKNKLKSMVSFATDVRDNACSSPKYTKKSSTSKFFFGSRPNTPSKQISYFLDRFYEKPGAVKVSADDPKPLTPYNLIQTDHKQKTFAIPTVKAVADSNLMVDNIAQSSSVQRLTKKEKKAKILETVTDIRTFKRGLDFIENLKNPPKKEIKVR